MTKSSLFSFFALLFLSSLFLASPLFAQSPTNNNAGSAQATDDVYQKKLRPFKGSSQGAKKMGTLFVKANYRNYDITVDGKVYPTLYENEGVQLLPNVAHEVLVRATGGNNAIEKRYTVSLQSGEVMYLYVELGATAPKAGVPQAAPAAEAKGTATTGFISVTSELEGQVYVDGKLAIAKSPLERHPVSVGSHSVRIYFLESKKFSNSRDVFVSEGSTMNLHFPKE